MEEQYGTEKPNGVGGVFVEVSDGDGTTHRHRPEMQEGETLYSVFHRLLSSIFFPDVRGERAPLLHRIKGSVADNVPLLREASGNTGRNVLLWTRRGSPLRALLVISVSISSLLQYYLRFDFEFVYQLSSVGLMLAFAIQLLQQKCFIFSIEVWQPYPILEEGSIKLLFSLISHEILGFSSNSFLVCFILSRLNPHWPH